VHRMKQTLPNMFIAQYTYCIYSHGLVGGGTCGQCKPCCLWGLLIRVAPFHVSGATLHIYIYIYIYVYIYVCFLVTCKYMYAYIYRDDDDAMTTAAAISACKKIVHRYHLPGALDL